VLGIVHDHQDDDEPAAGLAVDVTRTIFIESVLSLSLYHKVCFPSKTEKKKTSADSSSPPLVSLQQRTMMYSQERKKNKGKKDRLELAKINRRR